MHLDHKIIFIVGNSRSGTTMMGNILNCNDSVHTFLEVHFFEHMVSVKDFHSTIDEHQAIELLSLLIFGQEQSFHRQSDLVNYTPESKNILAMIEPPYTKINIYYHFLKYWTEKNNKKISCEQTPKNLYYLKEIIENFDHVKIIQMVRDPRSVLLSQKNKWKRRFLGEKNVPAFETFRAWAHYHPIITARLWVSAIETSKHVKHNNIVIIKFEKLLAAPEKTVRNICQHCDIEFHNKMLNVPVVGSSIAMDMPDKKMIDQSKACTWKEGGISETELYLLQKIAKKQMNSLNYSIEDIRPNYFTLLYLLISFPIKLILAAMVNLGRMKSISETIKRRIKHS